MAYEKLSYKVIRKDDQFEIRQYEAYMIMRVNRNANQGFNTLFTYISGHNQQHQKIQMTVPVITDTNAEQYIAFTMPKDRRSNFPTPIDSSISVVNVPEQYYLSFSFKGHQRKAIKALEQLKNYANTNQIPLIDEAILMRYQPPFLPGFLKKNDIMVAIEKNYFSSN